VRSQTRGRAATAVPDDPLHPVPSAAELQQQLIEIVDRLAIDEGNGAAFVEHVLAALRMWHVVVDLDFDALQRQADAAVREAETGQALAQARLAQARAELARAEHALRHGPAAPERHSPAVPMRRGRMPEEAP
jgi:formate-dependent nitrite reductase cytochrome c552 subunit